MKEKTTETVAESRPVWESLETFARQGVQNLLQRVLEDLLSRSIVAYSDPIRQSRRHAALSTHAVDLTPVSPLHPPVVPWHSDTRLPRNVSESPLTTPVSASNLRRVVNFRRCIVRFNAAARVFAPPSGLATTRCRHIVWHLAF